MHRDVTPHNLFVTYEGAVKVVDFGIAKASTQPHLTKSGVIKGKLAYMSPEQVRGQRRSIAAPISSPSASCSGS